MRGHVHVCVCVCMRTHIYMHIYMLVQVHVLECAHALVVCVSMFACVYVYVHLCVCVCARAHMWALTPTIHAPHPSCTSCNAINVFQSKVMFSLDFRNKIGIQSPRYGGHNILFTQLPSMLYSILSHSRNRPDEP